MTAQQASPAKPPRWKRPMHVHQRCFNCGIPYTDDYENHPCRPPDKRRNISYMHTFQCTECGKVPSYQCDCGVDYPTFEITITTAEAQSLIRGISWSNAGKRYQDWGTGELALSERLKAALEDAETDAARRQSDD